MKRTDGAHVRAYQQEKDREQQEAIRQSNNLQDSAEATAKLSAETGQPADAIRPCIATMLDRSFVKGEHPRRDEAAVAIASELYRIGVPYERAVDRLEKWNSRNTPPIRERELGRAIDNGYSGRYQYGCKNPVLQHFCVGEGQCPCGSLGKKARKRTSNFEFLDHRWQRVLSNRCVLIYYAAIPWLEVQRNVGVGGRVCANHLQISEACGVSKKGIGRDLARLAEVGLIEYTPGAPRRWEGKASEIRRVIPIPWPKSTQFPSKHVGNAF